MLNMAKVELELIPDPDINILFEKDATGRIYYISNRYSKTHKMYLNQILTRTYYLKNVREADFLIFLVDLY